MMGKKVSDVGLEVGTITYLGDPRSRRRRRGGGGGGIVSKADNQVL